jgi:thimet oligopeptidase
VIAKDLYTVFQRDGVLDPRPARRYREAILERGGSKDAADMVRDFLGRDFGFDAYAAWLNGAESGSSMRAARAP